MLRETKSDYYWYNIKIIFAWKRELIYREMTNDYRNIEIIHWLDNLAHEIHFDELSGSRVVHTMTAASPITIESGRYHQVHYPFTCVVTSFNCKQMFILSSKCFQLKHDNII